MYVCLCNAISDKHVRKRACEGPCSVSDVYRAHGCQAQCGKCAVTIRGILAEVREAYRPTGGYLEGAAAAPSD